MQKMQKSIGNFLMRQAEIHKKFSEKRASEIILNNGPLSGPIQKIFDELRDEFRGLLAKNDKLENDINSIKININK